MAPHSWALAFQDPCQLPPHTITFHLPHSQAGIIIPLLPVGKLRLSKIEKLNHVSMSENQDKGSGKHLGISAEINSMHPVTW